MENVMVGFRRFRFATLPAAVLVVVLVLGACASSGERAQPPRTTLGPAPSTTTVAPSTTTVPSSSAVPSTSSPVGSAYVGLYPFADAHEVAAWQQGYRESRARAQYLDADATALAFAHFLGYATVDRVVSHREDAKGAHVSVGYTVPQTARSATAAVVHLIRYGTGDVVPWEVVGTDDTDFTLEVPAHGATVSSPLSVGGHITGVDERIRVVVQQLHSNGSLGTTCCVPAGGSNTRWSAEVSFARPTDHIVIVAASTGGHVATLERFAVTGVRV